MAVGRDRRADGTFATEKLSRPLTVLDLLTFTSGIGARDDSSDLGQEWAERDIYAGEGSLKQRVNRILRAPLYEQPGNSWRYGWSASDALDWTPGGSGLVSTAGDYMRFALMLWNGGAYDGTRVLTRESVARMTHPHVSGGVLADEGIEGQGWGLGLSVVVDADATPTIDRDGDFWWAGYYGTNFFVSPETGLVGVVMSQNQPGPFSGLPYAVYLAPAFAFWGL